MDKFPSHAIDSATARIVDGADVLKWMTHHRGQVQVKTTTGAIYEFHHQANDKFAVIVPATVGKKKEILSLDGTEDAIIILFKSSCIQWYSANDCVKHFCVV
jgi:hypothetical protein